MTSIGVETAVAGKGMAHMAPQTKIISQLSSRFAEAFDAEYLFFFPSTVHRHKELGIEFEIRLCPALQNKPVLPVPEFPDSPPQGSGKPDPFSEPYRSKLTIGELIDTNVEEDEDIEKFVCMMNKFSVVEKHFLLVTDEYKSQTLPLTPSELVQSFLLIDAAHEIGYSYFAFYNCGDASGASQPHKHVQFIPVDDDGPPVEALARDVRLDSDWKAFMLPGLPYAIHVRRLPHLDASTPHSTLREVLLSAFMTLLDLAISSVRHAAFQPTGRPSYNVLLTRKHMYVVPRSHEAHVLQTGEALSVNALGFAGMLLVKSEVELDAVKKEGVVEILKGVGVPPVRDEVAEAHERDDE